MSDRLSVMLDTNIWLDHYAPKRENSALATQVILAAIQANAQLLYPVHCIKDVAYGLEVILKAAKRQSDAALSDQDALAIKQVVWSFIGNMSALAVAVTADNSDVKQAMRYRELSSDFEDNFIMVAAERAHAAILVTRDERLLRKSTVPAYTPEDAVRYLETHA